MKNKLFAITMGSILSTVSVPSAICFMKAAVIVPIASVALSTDAYAKKSKSERKQEKLEKLKEKWEKADVAGKTKKANRLNNKI